jgi:hypothetical protein
MKITCVAYCHDMAPPDLDSYECVQKRRGMAACSCPPALGMKVRAKKSRSLAGTVE